jgi:hypothetical protein
MVYGVIMSSNERLVIQTAALLHSGMTHEKIGSLVGRSTKTVQRIRRKVRPILDEIRERIQDGGNSDWPGSPGHMGATA